MERGGPHSDAVLDEAEFHRWRAEADNAMEGARLQREGGVFNWACFSAEQAGQLALKAVLHGVGQGPWGHDLVRLGEMLREAGIAVSDDVQAALRRLSRHYIPARYPDAHPSGTPSTHYGASECRGSDCGRSSVTGFRR